jgi:hypothetical protein
VAESVIPNKYRQHGTLCTEITDTSKHFASNIINKKLDPLRNTEFIFNDFNVMRICGSASENYAYKCVINCNFCFTVGASDTI